MAVGGDESVQRVTAAVHGLSRKLGSTAFPDNRTRVLITLTDDGSQTFKAAVRESDMVESDVLGPLSVDQREDLAAVLELLIKGLDENPRQLALLM